MRGLSEVRASMGGEKVVLAIPALVHYGDNPASGAKARRTSTI